MNWWNLRTLVAALLLGLGPADAGEDLKEAQVLAAMKRAKEIVKGAKSLSEETENKAVVLALREIAEGKVNVIYPKDYVR